MSTLPVALRVKRRRDCAAEAIPAEIILETSSRPQDALAASLQHTLAVTQSTTGTLAAPEGPERKRCRFVLVPGPAAPEAADVAIEAAEAGKQPEVANGPVLELWHTSGLSASASSAAHRSVNPAAVSGQLQEDAAQCGGVYAAMVQQYLTEHQQQQHAAAEPTQHRTYQRPTTRRHQHSSSTTPSQQPSPAHQQHLPAYMTKGMLKQYGLWPTPQQVSQQVQQQQQGVAAAAAAGLAGAFPTAIRAADANVDDSMDEDYTYDVYVAAQPGSSTAGQAHASTDPNSSQQDVGADRGPAGELPVIQVGFCRCFGVAAVVEYWQPQHGL